MVWIRQEQSALSDHGDAPILVKIVSLFEADGITDPS